MDGVFAAAAWLVTAAAAAVLLVAVLPRAAARRSGGFAGYYASSRLLVAGAPAARFYDDVWFRSNVEQLVPGASENFLNPPTTAFVLVPLAHLPPEDARRAVLAASVLALGVALFLLAREQRFTGVLLPGFVTWALVALPVRLNFLEGQLYTVFLLLLVVSFAAERKGRWLIAGSSLGVLFAIKLMPLPVWLALAAARRFKTVAVAGATFLGIVAATWPRLNGTAWSAFLDHAAAFSRNPVLGVTAIQSNAGFFRHFFSRDPVFSPFPLLHAPWLAEVLTVCAAAVLAWLVWRVASADAELGFAAGITAGLVALPVTASVSFVLAVLPVAVLLGRFASGRAASWLVVASMLLIALGIRPAPSDAPPAAALLGYGGLLGGWLLTAAAYLESRRRKVSGA